MPQPKLSVVVPNYNHGLYLSACLESLLNQSWQPDEIIVIDDASTDNSVDVIHSFVEKYPQIQLIRNPQNQGVLYNLNSGLEIVTGDFVYFPAADDTVAPGLFEKSLSLLARHPTAALSCTIADWHEIHTGLHWQMSVGMADNPCYLSPEQMVALERQGKLYIASNTAIVRRQAIIETGKYRPELKWHCDWFALYVAGFRYGICYIPEPLAVFNIHPTSYYNRGIRDKPAHRQLLKRILGLLETPEYRDAGERIRQSGALFIFGKQMLGVLLKNRQYWRYLTLPFLRKNLWHIFKLEMKRILPVSIGNWYLRLAGYHSRQKTGSHTD